MESAGARCVRLRHFLSYAAQISWTTDGTTFVLAIIRGSTGLSSREYSRECARGYACPSAPEEKADFV